MFSDHFARRLMADVGPQPGHGSTYTPAAAPRSNDLGELFGSIMARFAAASLLDSSVPPPNAAPSSAQRMSGMIESALRYTGDPNIYK